MVRGVTISDVAAEAGVHKATAARALSPRTEHLVKSATLSRVRSAAVRLGYVPNAIARSLSTDLSLSVGLVVPDLTNPIFPPIARGVESYLSPRGYTALIANTDSRTDLEEIVFKSLTERRVDGFLMATGRDDHPLLRQARQQGIHVVLINRSIPGLDFSLVAPDMLHGFGLILQHLQTLGHRRVTFFAGPPGFTVGNARTETFQDSAAAGGFEARVQFADELSIEGGYRLMSATLSSGLPIETAVVASNDLLAIGAIQAIRHHGYRCPEDISVTGFNDMRFAELIDPPLTTVRVPYHAIGSEAARLLLDELAGSPAAPPTVTVPGELVIRASTAPPAL